MEWLVHVERIEEIKCRRLRRSGHVAKMEDGRNTFKNVTGKAAGKRPLGKPRPYGGPFLECN